MIPALLGILNSAQLSRVVFNKKIHQVAEQGLIAAGAPQR
jgi:hypothetical protein